MNDENRRHARRNRGRFPDGSEEPEDAGSSTGAKLLEYVMLGVLLFLCFLLPRTGAKKASGEGAQRKLQTEAAGTADETKDAGNEGTENRVIVIDAGHGGSYVRKCGCLTEHFQGNAGGCVSLILD